MAGTIGEHSDECPLSDIRPRQIRGKVGEAKPGQRGLEHHPGTVEHKLSFDPNLQLTLSSLEFPGVKPPKVGSRKLMQW
jgi:hypothetical protein